MEVVEIVEGHMMPDTATIQKYIREQERQDPIEDSLSKKEYADPFKGSK